MLFRTGGTPTVDNRPATLGKGFLIDGLSMLSGTPPTNKEQCKNNGWQSLSRNDGSSFKNQGDCVQFVNTGK